MNKFSVIIPCYNAASYIKRCLDSIVSQTYSNFEIVIVNDGSTDDSLNIIKNYQNYFKNIKCINQTHSGVAVARNVGVKNISGNKFIFVDADDYINAELLWHLNEALKITDSDIVRYNACLIVDNIKNNKKYFCEKFNTTNGKNTLKFFIDRNTRYGPLWLYCYDTEFFKFNNFSFIKNKIHEDFYNIFILSKAMSIQGIEYIGYNYIKNSESITSAKSITEEVRRSQDVLYVYDYVIKKLEETFKYCKSDFDYIYDDITSFLNVGLKYLTGKDKEKYEKEINIRKLARGSMNGKIRRKNK